ncbi:MAG: hypothetical protein D6682_08445 [Zetaproteobacteria bacterium]|nr:MAG: hypothetical protein D6682_08445 [Zetaproteobacteria bacterium]
MGAAASGRWGVAGDLWGGISAAALILPQAMAFGIALWLPVHGDSAAAALAGLLTAALLSAASGLARATCGMVSAPTGPTLVLLSGLVAGLQAHGLSGDALTQAMLFTLAMAGLLQLIVGALGLGAIIKFMPYPVVSGFMTGTGILMVLSQEKALLPSAQAIGWLPLATAGVTLAAMHWLPRYVRGVPATVLGLVAGTLFFHLVRLLAGWEVRPSWVVGSLPPLQIEGPAVPSWQQVWQMPWTMMALSAAALALLASLDTLLTAVIADVATGCRHDARRELMAQGAGHLCAALIGGMAGAGTTGATLVAIESGGRRWCALVTALSIMVVVLLLAPLAAWLPVSVFSGIIIHVSLFGMLDGEIIEWLKRRSARLDAAIALVVVAVTIYYDLLAAVAVGVVLAVVEFLRTQVGRSAIHRRWGLGERSSLRNRPRAEREAIARLADHAAGYDLQGALFFGSADSLYGAISSAPERFVILSLRRVSQVDLTALHMIGQIAGLLRGRGGALLISHAGGRMELARCKGRQHAGVVPFHAGEPIATFAQTEDAIEHVENLLLQEEGITPSHHQARCAVREAALFSGLSDKQFARVVPLLTHRRAAAGTYLFRCGDPGDALCVVLAGEVEVLLPYRKKKRMRLAVCGPGMAVGEAAFLHPGPRTADLKAISDVEWVELAHGDLLALADAHPRLAMTLVTRLASELGARLAAADAMLRRLAA